MHLKERVIREELRRQAGSVSAPDDLWERINQQLDQNPPPGLVKKGGTQRYRGPVKRLIAVGAAAGIFWVLISPAGVGLDQPGRSTNGAGTAVHAATPAKRPMGQSQGRAASDARWPTLEITLLR